MHFAFVLLGAGISNSYQWRFAIGDLHDALAASATIKKGAASHQVCIQFALMPRMIEMSQSTTARLAQSAERKALNLVVVGSTPTVGAFEFVLHDVIFAFSSNS